MNLPPFLAHFCFLMIRRPPRSTLDRSSAASDVYKRQVRSFEDAIAAGVPAHLAANPNHVNLDATIEDVEAVSYTHLRAHETVLDLVCRLLLEKTKNNSTHYDERVRQE